MSLSRLSGLAARVTRHSMTMMSVVGNGLVVPKAPSLVSRAGYACLSAVRPLTVVKPKSVLGGCDCGGTCGLSQSASELQGDRDLAQFLNEEIAMEKKLLKPLPSLKGWQITQDGPEVSLTSQQGQEEITVKFNVNHTVNPVDEFDEAQPPQSNPDQPPEMKAKPEFVVEIRRRGSKLGFSCGFVEDGPDTQPPAAAEEDIQDVFNINAVSIYKDEFKDDIYAVSGDIMDGNLYDLLMNMLADRGIDENFAKSISDYATAYEHNLYVNLLEGIKSFVSSN